MLPDTKQRLEVYLALLNKWQKALNLVSPASLGNAWQRHFLDSIQLESLIPANCRKLADLGSGGGFPGMVLAISRPDIEVILIESVERKCEFLRTVSRETKAENVKVYNCRIEDFAAQEDAPCADVLTARALAPVDKLLTLAGPFFQASPECAALFMKGSSSIEEVERARKSWAFDYKTYDSVTREGACILEMKAPRRL